MDPVANAQGALLRESIYRRSQANTHSILATEARKKGATIVAQDHEDAARMNFDRELELLGLAHELHANAGGR